MNTITTRSGKQVTIISQCDLRQPVARGDYVRAFCHIHGSDHQRSLSINRSNGWGHCFNAACNATVLVEEWHTPMLHDPLPFARRSSQDLPTRRLPLALQPVLLHTVSPAQPWQNEEVRALHSLKQVSRWTLTHSQRVQAYCVQRGIPIALAAATGAGYLSPTLLSRLRSRADYRLLQRWTGRIIFPLRSPAGIGYIGRSLWRWQPGIREDRHKELLELRGAPQRWLKTNPAGWFCEPFEQLAETIIVVEGPFDRLTLLAAGFPAEMVVALAGTAMQPEWLPPQVRTLILALDCDNGGSAATERLEEQLREEGFTVKTSPPPYDRWGKDWNERWQRVGRRSTWSLQALLNMPLSASA